MLLNSELAALWKARMSPNAYLEREEQEKKMMTLVKPIKYLIKKKQFRKYLHF